MGGASIRERSSDAVMTKEERIAQLSKASDWRAAFMILASDRLREDARVWKHVDLKHERIHFDRMLNNGTWSGGERALIEIAASLFSTDQQINLWRSFGRLDEEACALAVRAIASYSELAISVEAGH